MLPGDEYQVLKLAHMAQRNRPPIPKPMNFHKTSTSDSSYQVPCSAWSDSTASEVGGFSAFKNFKRRASKGRPTRHEHRIYGRSADVSTSNPNKSVAAPRNLINDNTGPPFGGFDPAAYEAAQALGHGSIYGVEALRLDEKSSTQQQTRSRPVRQVQRRSSTGSDIKAWAQRQPHSQWLFHSPEDAADTEPNRLSSINRLAFSEATQGVNHDPSMPMNLGPEHFQYWASRQADMGKVRAQSKYKCPLPNGPRLEIKQFRAPSDRLPGRGYDNMDTGEAFFVPERPKRQRHHGRFYEDLRERPLPPPPRKKVGGFKSFWKKIF